MTGLRNHSDQNLTSDTCSGLQTPASLGFFIGLHSLLFVVGLCLNTFSLHVHFCSRPRPRCSVAVYFRNLAVADFLLSLSLPIRIAHYASHPALWSPAPLVQSHTPRPLHWFYCSVGAAFFYLNMYASILFMGYIAANRYLKILRPLGSHWLQSYQGSCLAVGVSWLTMCCMTGVYMSLSLVSSRRDKPVQSVSCDSNHSPQVALLYVLIHSCLFVFFFCVLLALLFFYYSISRRLKATSSRRRQTSRKLQRAQRNMLLLWVVFCICFVPYHTVRLPFALLSGRCSRVLYFLKELSVLLSTLNVCLDPLVYFLFSQSFRVRLGQSRLFRTTSSTANANANTRDSANEISEAIATDSANAVSDVSTTAKAKAISDASTTANAISDANTTANANAISNATGASEAQSGDDRSPVNNRDTAV